MLFGICLFGFTEICTGNKLYPSMIKKNEESKY